MADADAFLAKAEESLASAEDDFAKVRFNSCARSAYYAAFLLAVAALLIEGLSPMDRWEHRYVHARFAGILVRQRKVYPQRYTRLLVEAQALRNRGDYSELGVGRRPVNRILEAVRLLGGSVKERQRGNR